MIDLEVDNYGKVKSYTLNKTDLLKIVRAEIEESETRKMRISYAKIEYILSDSSSIRVDKKNLITGKITFYKGKKGRIM